VQIEVRAAELVAMRALEPGRFMREASDDEALGFEQALQGFGPGRGRRANRDEEAGWLAWHIEHHDALLVLNHDREKTPREGTK
jgi:hypothetical protein